MFSRSVSTCASCVAVSGFAALSGGGLSLTSASLNDGGLSGSVTGLLAKRAGGVAGRWGACGPR